MKTVKMKIKTPIAGLAILLAGAFSLALVAAEGRGGTEYPMGNVMVLGATHYDKIHHEEMSRLLVVKGYQGIKLGQHAGFGMMVRAENDAVSTAMLQMHGQMNERHERDGISGNPWLHCRENFFKGK